MSEKHSHSTSCCYFCWKGPDTHPVDTYDPACEEEGCSMDELTKSIVELEGMQDVPLPGMEDIVETPEKISEEFPKEFVYRVVGASGEPQNGWFKSRFYRTVNTAKGMATRLNKERYGGDKPYRAQRAKVVDWEDV